MWFLVVINFLVAPYASAGGPYGPPYDYPNGSPYDPPYGPSYGNDLKHRLLHGQKADITDFPYFAALKNCGAAIISDSWLITAAHCVATDVQKFGTAWVGGNDIKTSQPVRYDTVVIHPEFRTTDPRLSNDVALLKLDKPLTFGPKIKSVALPPDYDEEFYSRVFNEGRTYTVAGKGIRKGNLLKIDVTPINAEECLSHFSLAERILMYPYWYQLNNNYICAKWKGGQEMPGLSQRASGSPLVHNNVLGGLAVPFGNPLDSTVSTFTKITVHTEWIRFITGIRSGIISTPEPRETDLTTQVPPLEVVTEIFQDYTYHLSGTYPWLLS